MLPYQACKLAPVIGHLPCKFEVLTKLLCYDVKCGNIFLYKEGKHEGGLLTSWL